jgi:hypothetical protein
MDDGSQRSLGWIDRRPTGFCSSTTGREYHSPGGAGIANALLDVYTLTLEPRCLTKAEEIIRRCIHPHDDIQDRRLDEPEYRWSYLVFLQVLGKYLDCKMDKSEIDYMYRYAQASLLYYAEWMLEHEAPYATVLDKVEIPTETWPAQDIRKRCSLIWRETCHWSAAETFQEKSFVFLDTCIKISDLFRPVRSRGLLSSYWLMPTCIHIFRCIRRMWLLNQMKYPTLVDHGRFRRNLRNYTERGRNFLHGYVR